MNYSPREIPSHKYSVIGANSLLFADFMTLGRVLKKTVRKLGGHMAVPALTINRAAY